MQLHTKFVIEKWATFSGMVVIHIGFGWFLWMMIASIRHFRREKPHTTARQILLPYSVISTLANSAFAATLIFGQGLNLVAKHSTLAGAEDKTCSPVNMTSTLLMTLLFFMNDALFLYRTCVMFEWKLWYLIAPVGLYLGVLAAGITFSAQCASLMILANGAFVNNILLALTAALNTLLATMIGVKLIRARGAALAAGACCPGSLYMTTLSVVVESAFAWTVSIIFCLVSNMGFIDLKPLFPFFRSLVQIMSLLAPATLLYRIAHGMHENQRPTSSPLQIDRIETQLEKGGTPINRHCSVDSQTPLVPRPIRSASIHRHHSIASSTASERSSRSSEQHWQTWKPPIPTREPVPF